jgi:hypothetical protein
MPQPIWRKIVTEMMVPEQPGIPWTLVLEYLTPGKLMKIEVVVDLARVPPVAGTWTPRGFVAACTADGDFLGTARGNAPQQGDPLLVSAAPVGALIACIGGSTADQAVDSNPNPQGATPKRLCFAVGRTCVFSVPQAPLGALFMGVNDHVTRMAGMAGSLLVNVYEGL